MEKRGYYKILIILKTLYYIIIFNLFIIIYLFFHNHL